MSIEHERAARNEALFREVNERVQELEERLGSDGEALDVVCECADDACIEKLTVPVGVYEQVRSNPRRFLLRRGHQDPGVEELVSVRDEYVIVEKRGQAGEVAEKTDPR